MGYYYRDCYCMDYCKDYYCMDYYCACQFNFVGKEGKVVDSWDCHKVEKNLDLASDHIDFSCSCY